MRRRLLGDPLRFPLGVGELLGAVGAHQLRFLPRGGEVRLHLRLLLRGDPRGFGPPGGQRGLKVAIRLRGLFPRLGEQTVEVGALLLDLLPGSLPDRLGLLLGHAEQLLDIGAEVTERHPVGYADLAA